MKKLRLRSSALVTYGDYKFTVINELRARSCEGCILNRCACILMDLFVVEPCIQVFGKGKIVIDYEKTWY